MVEFNIDKLPWVEEIDDNDDFLEDKADADDIDDWEVVLDPEFEFVLILGIVRTSFDKLLPIGWYSNIDGRNRSCNEFENTDGF